MSTITASPDPVITTSASFDLICSITASPTPVISNSASDLVSITTASLAFSTSGSPDCLAISTDVALNTDTTPASPPHRWQWIPQLWMRQWLSAPFLFQHALFVISLVLPVHFYGNTLILCISPALSFYLQVFFTSCNRLICSVSTCRWASHEQYHNTGCRRLLKPGQHCNAPLVLANEIPNPRLS